MTRLRQKHPSIQYVSAAEVQDGKRGGVGRGLLHRHVLMHSAKALGAAELQQLAMDAGFGCVMDLQELPLNVAAAARYAAKYVSKSVDQRAMVPWSRMMLDEATGEIVERTKPTFRTWSSSSSWGMTMREIKDTNLASLRASTVTLRAEPNVTKPAEPQGERQASSGPEPPT